MQGQQHGGQHGQQQQLPQCQQTRPAAAAAWEVPGSSRRKKQHRATAKATSQATAAAGEHATAEVAPATALRKSPLKCWYGTGSHAAAVLRTPAAEAMAVSSAATGTTAAVPAVAAAVTAAATAAVAAEVAAAAQGVAATVDMGAAPEMAAGPVEDAAGRATVAAAVRAAAAAEPAAAAVATAAAAAALAAVGCVLSESFSIPRSATAWRRYKWMCSTTLLSCGSAVAHAGASTLWRRVAASPLYSLTAADSSVCGAAGDACPTLVAAAASSRESAADAAAAGAASGVSSSPAAAAACACGSAATRVHRVAAAIAVTAAAGPCSAATAAADARLKCFAAAVGRRAGAESESESSCCVICGVAESARKLEKLRFLLIAYNSKSCSITTGSSSSNSRSCSKSSRENSFRATSSISKNISLGVSSRSGSSCTCSSTCFGRRASSSNSRASSSHTAGRQFTTRGDDLGGSSSRNSSSSRRPSKSMRRSKKDGVLPTVALPLLLLLVCSVQRASAGEGPTVCDAGTYYSAAAASCQPCPADRYAPAAGLTECMPCPQQATTLGQTGCSSLRSCACPADYYLNAAASICSTCPLPANQFYCPGNLTTENFSTRCSTISAVAEGWWYGRDVADWPAVYQKCPVIQACVGGCGACREGHTGRLCQMCVPGWTRNFFNPLSVCSECPPTWQLLLRYFACAAGLTLAVTLCCFCTCHAAMQRICGIPDDERSAFVPALKLFLSYLVVWGIYGLQADVDTQGAGRDVSTFAVAADLSASSPSYFLRYISAARDFLLLLVAGQGFDCWTRRNAMSPIFLFTCVVSIFPLVVVGLLLLTFSLYFLIRKRKPPPVEDRLLLEFAKAPWPHLLGERLTAYFSAAVSVFLFFWIPQATLYYASAFQCTTLASGEKVQLYDPNIACGGFSYANATQVALPGAALGSVGVPVILLLVLLYYMQLLEEPRYIQIFNFSMDFYRGAMLFWEPLRLLLLCSLVAVAQQQQQSLAGVKASLLATLLALYASVFAFARPFIPENTPPWRFRLRCFGRRRRRAAAKKTKTADASRKKGGMAKENKEVTEEKKNGKNEENKAQADKEGEESEYEDEEESFFGGTIKISRKRHLRELLAWISMAVLFELEAVRISLSEGMRRRLVEGLIILLCTVTQLLLLLWLLAEIKQILWPYIQPLLQRCCRCCCPTDGRRPWRRGGRYPAASPGGTAAAAEEEGRDMGEGAGGGELLMHKFFRKDERFFVDAVRLAPFPEEALAQLHALLAFERFHSADIDEAATWLLQQGHLELQGQTLHAAFPRISEMYSDMAYDFGGDDFTKEMEKLFRTVAVSLNIEQQVRERQAAATEIRQLYAFVAVGDQLQGRGGEAAAEAAAAALQAAAARAAAEEEEAAAAEEDVTWQEFLGGETAADVQLRWLRLHMHPEEREATVKRSQFTLIFPSAAPVVRQDELLTQRQPPPVQRSPNFFERLAEYAFGRKETSLPSSPPPPRDPLDIHF